jgi:tetrahydrodipicolinate N-succinyltransferase
MSEKKIRPIDPEASYKVEETKAFLNCSTNQVYKLLRSGKLKHYNLNTDGKNQVFRIKGKDILEFQGANQEEYVLANKLNTTIRELEASINSLKN